MGTNLKKFINYSEQILFTGIYDITRKVVDENTVTIPMDIDANSNGYNVLSDVYYSIQDNLVQPNVFLNETITIKSYNNDLTIISGQIQFIGLYPNANSYITSSTFQVYDVNSSSGIYDKVTKVIIDYSNSKNADDLSYIASFFNSLNSWALNSWHIILLNSSNLLIPVDNMLILGAAMFQ